MNIKILDIENPESFILRSWTTAIPLGNVNISIVVTGSEHRAELKVRGERFAGKGESAMLAVQDLTATIRNAAIKRQRRGRTPDRVRVAATLLQGGPN